MFIYILGCPVRDLNFEVGVGQEYKIKCRFAQEYNQIYIV